MNISLLTSRQFPAELSPPQAPGSRTIIAHQLRRHVSHGRETWLLCSPGTLHNLLFVKGIPFQIRVVVSIVVLGEENKTHKTKRWQMFTYLFVFGGVGGEVQQNKQDDGQCSTLFGGRWDIYTMLPEVSTNMVTNIQKWVIPWYFPGRTRKVNSNLHPSLPSWAFQVTWWLRLPTWNHPLPPVVRPSPAAAKSPFLQGVDSVDVMGPGRWGATQKTHHLTFFPRRKKKLMRLLLAPPQKMETVGAFLVDDVSARDSLRSMMGKKRSFS